MFALDASHPAPALVRVPVGAPRDRSHDAEVRATVRGAWDGVRLLDVHVGPGVIPLGCLMNHVVALNSGPGGESHFDVLGWVTNCTPRGVSVYPARVPYAARVHRPCNKIAVEIAPDVVAAMVASAPAGRTELEPCVGAQDPFAEHVVLALSEVARTDPEPQSICVRSLVTALVHHLLLRGARRGDQGGALGLARLRAVSDHVAAHLDRPIPVAELASVAGLGPARFVRAFRRSTGVPPHRFVLQARVERAKALLADLELSISDVALATGFATPSHFATVFRRSTGATPRGFRGAVL